MNTIVSRTAGLLILSTMIALTLLFGCGCGDEDGNGKGLIAAKKDCRLALKKNQVALGQVLDFAAKNVNDKKAVKEHALSLDGMAYEGATLETEGLALGKHRLTADFVYSDSSTCSSYKNFFVFSDIEPQIFSYSKVATYAHDPNAFTQGLEFVGDRLYEGTGQYGDSYIREYDPTAQDFQEKVKLSPSYFGEGITILGDRLYQITYKENTGFEYDLNTMEVLREWSFENEGWGLTNDGTHLIMTDGSNRLSFFDPMTLTKVKELYVYDHKGEVDQINELEYMEGSIYANLYGNMAIAQIEAETGRLLAIIDCSGLVEQNEMAGDMDVMNGIAYRASSGTFFLTGKYWPKMYEVRFFPKGS